MDYEKLYKEMKARVLEIGRGYVNSVDFSKPRQIAEYIEPELKDNEGEKIKQAILGFLEGSGQEIIVPGISIKEATTWLEKQGEHKPIMIQWKGDNLKEVIDFIGKNRNFDKWFTSFQDYEKYVHEHNDIFKLFNEDGSHYEVPVGAWIVKTPDGYNVASKAIFKQKSVEQDTEIRDLWVYIREWNDKFGRLPKDEDELAVCIDYVMKRQKPANEIEQNPAWSEEDEKLYNSALWHIKNSCGNGGRDSGEFEVYNWLKSIKYRVKPQSKQDWCDEDEKIINDAIWLIEHYATDGHKKLLREQTIDKLKSLKPQKHWKPSEQNIKDLEWCADLVKDKMGAGFHRLQVFIDELKSL